MDKAQEGQDSQAPETKAPEATPAWVRLAHESSVGDWEIGVGGRRYAVVGGVVQVDPVDVQAARQEGFLVVVEE